MEKDILIHVKGIQFLETGEEQEPIELVVPGQYYFRNGAHYIRYEEMVDDSGKPTVNYIKMSDRGAEVSKKGQVNVHMVFEQGKRNRTFYTTPFGTLQLGISATHMQISQDENELKAKVDYSLDMNEEYVADCYLDIQAQTARCENFSL